MGRYPRDFQNDGLSFRQFCNSPRWVRARIALRRTEIGQISTVMPKMNNSSSESQNAPNRLKMALFRIRLKSLRCIAPEIPLRRAEVGQISTVMPEMDNSSFESQNAANRLKMALFRIRQNWPQRHHLNGAGKFPRKNTRYVCYSRFFAVDLWR